MRAGGCEYVCENLLLLTVHPNCVQSCACVRARARVWCVGVGACMCVLRVRACVRAGLRAGLCVCVCVCMRLV